MSIYSFRAQSDDEIDEFVTWAMNTKHDLFMTVREALFLENGAPSGDIAVEVHTSMSLRELQDSMRQTGDGYVMLQTLRALPVVENDFYRNRHID